MRNFLLNLLDFENTLKLGKIERLFAILAPLRFVCVCKLKENDYAYGKWGKNCLKSICA